MRDVGGDVIESGTRFLVSDTVKFVLSVGELGHHGWNTTVGTMPCLSHFAGCQVPLTRKGNTFYLSARLGFYGEAPWKMVAMTSVEGATPSPSGRELRISSASGALLPALTEALPVPLDAVPEDVPLRPVLSAWSPVAALRDRLKSRPSMVRLTARKMSCGSHFVNTRPERNNNFVNDSGLKLQRMSSFRVQDFKKPRFWMLQANLKIRWK